MVSLLFSFRGRINRKQYWFGTSLVGFISFFGRMLTTALSSTALVDVKDPSTALSSVMGAGVLALPLFVLTVWCGLAVQFKRFHDRGRTGWISMIPLVLGVLFIGSVLGDILGHAPLERLFNDALPYFGLLMLTGLAFFIDLGCMGSVEGPNKYGPPPDGPRTPLEPVKPRAAVDVSSSLFGAQSAIDRAITERAQPANSNVATPAPTPPPAIAYERRFNPKPAAVVTPPAFGRRAQR
jgi:uncharacterized membrane protein YhaH (DUF805 family)